MRDKRENELSRLPLGLGKLRDKRDKKGELLVNETLKIILSVIVIGVLVFFLTSLYFSKVYDEKFLSAQSTIERISEIVDAGGGEVDALVPKDWSVFAFVMAEKPNSCAGQSCLCLCDSPSWYEVRTTQLEECSEKGVCTVVPGMVDFEEIKIEKDLTSIKIENVGGQFIVSKK